MATLRGRLPADGTGRPPSAPRDRVNPVLCVRYGWWTRNETIRTLARWRLELPLRDPFVPPAYQRLAAKAAALRRRGYSDHCIAVEIGVTDKTVAKAVRWFESGGRVAS